MDIIKVSGLVSDLQVTRGNENLSFSENEKVAVGMSAVATAIFQESLSSTSFANISANADMEMDFFTCTVGSEKIKGSFYKVGFENGQYIEFAISQYEDNQVHAACDPLKRLIWTRPHRTKGYLAQKRSNLVGSIVISIIAAISLFLAGYLSGDTGRPLRMQSAVYQGCLSFVLTIILCFFVCRRIYDDPIGATLAFDALGFLDPSKVNLPRIHRQAKKFYKAESGSEDVEDVPWRFRYTKSTKLN